MPKNCRGPKCYLKKVSGSHVCEDFPEENSQLHSICYERRSLWGLSQKVSFLFSKKGNVDPGSKLKKKQQMFLGIIITACDPETQVLVKILDSLG
jgi:hypothetical protein